MESDWGQQERDFRAEDNTSEHEQSDCGEKPRLRWGRAGWGIGYQEVDCNVDWCEARSRCTVTHGGLAHVPGNSANMFGSVLPIQNGR